MMFIVNGIGIYWSAGMKIWSWAGRIKSVVQAGSEVHKVYRDDKRTRGDIANAIFQALFVGLQGGDLAGSLCSSPNQQIQFARGCADIARRFVKAGAESNKNQARDWDILMKDIQSAVWDILPVITHRMGDLGLTTEEQAQYAAVCLQKLVELELLQYLPYYNKKPKFTTDFDWNLELSDLEKIDNNTGQYGKFLKDWIILKAYQCCLQGISLSEKTLNWLRKEKERPSQGIDSKQKLPEEGRIDIEPVLRL